MHFGLLASSPSLRWSRFTVGADARLQPVVALGVVVAEPWAQVRPFRSVVGEYW